MKKLILALLFITSNMMCETIKIKFFSRSELQKLGFYHDENGFHIVQDDQIIDIPVYQVDKLVRNINQEQIKAFLDKGYLSITQTDHNEFVIRANVRGLGGGPYTASLVYCATKAALIGSLTTATAAAICVTGTAAAGATVAYAAGAATAAGTATGVSAAVAGSLVTSATLGSGAGAVIAGSSVVMGTEATIGLTAMIASASVGTIAAAPVAAGATIAGATSAGIIAGSATAIAIAIETASLAAAAPFLASPWCP